MKVARFLVGLFGLLLFIFAILSFLGLEIIYNNEITINAPKTKVWQTINDQEKGGQWLTGLKKVEVVKAVPGNVGRILNMTYENDGNKTVIKETTTEFKENESLALTMEADIFINHNRMDLFEKDGRTILRTRSKVKGRGFFFRGMMPMMKKIFKQEEMKMLNNLKVLVEE